MTSYAIVIEQAANNFAAYAPDVPGCMATGATVDEVTTLMTEALEMHIELMRASGEDVPEPATVVRSVDISS